MSDADANYPVEIRQLTQEGMVVIDWDSGETFRYTMEYLRVACPCADCRGHTPSQRKLIDGKQEVRIDRILPVGHYAVKLFFSDGHDSGVYSWETLHDLGARGDFYWQEYLQELEVAGKDRQFCTLPVAKSCGSGGCH